MATLEARNFPLCSREDLLLWERDILADLARLDDPIPRLHVPRLR